MSARMLLIAAVAMAIVGSAVAAGTTRKAELHVFATQARVEIGADGKVTTVTPDPALPAAVGQQIQSTVGAWQFAMPLKDGEPVSGVTYVRMGACAAPVEDGYRLAFAYHGNGPNRVESTAPRFPEQQARAGTSAKLQLVYRVGADGTAVIEQIGVEEGGPSAARDFRESLEEWLRNSKFEPEQLDGQAVATRVSFTVEYIVATRTFGSSKQAARDAALRQQAQATQSAPCKIALGNAAKLDRTVALDSPFKLLSAIE